MATGDEAKTATNNRKKALVPIMHELSLATEWDRTTL